MVELLASRAARPSNEGHGGERHAAVELNWDGLGACSCLSSDHAMIDRRFRRLAGQEGICWPPEAGREGSA